MKPSVVELVTYLHTSDFKTQQCRGKYLKDKKELTQNKEEKQKNLKTFSLTILLVILPLVLSFQNYFMYILILTYSFINV